MNRDGSPGADLSTQYPSDPPQVIYAGLAEAVTSTAIAVSSTGLAQIAFSTATGIYFLREVTTGTGWEFETILASGMLFPPVHIALQKDVPWVSYADFEAKYRIRAATRGAMAMGWSVETVVDQGVARSPGSAPIVLTKDDKLAIFRAAEQTSPYAIYIAFSARSGTAWQGVGSLTQGTPHSVGRDSNGILSVLYTQSSLAVPTYLGYARQYGGTWIFKQVESLETTGAAQLAIDSLNHLHMIYCNDGKKQVNYGYSDTDGDEWQINPLEFTRSAYQAIGIAPGDVPVVAYHHPGKHAAQFARRAAGRWRLETLDDGGDVGQALSLAMDRMGRAHIVYYDATSRTLKRAIR